MAGASVDSCQFVVLRSPRGRLGSIKDVGNRLPRMRGCSHRCIHISKVWTCPDKIPGCAQFLRRWPTDQGAFNVLYDMYTTKNKTKMFTIGNCTLFNGSPSHDECKGEIVTHAWGGTKQNTSRRRSPAARNLLGVEGVVVLAVVLVLVVVRVGVRRRLRK